MELALRERGRMRTRSLTAALAVAILTVSVIVGTNVTGQPANHVKWLYLLYLDADNNLDVYTGAHHISMVESDFDELMSVGSTDDVACYVLVDRWTGPANLFKVNKGSMQEMTSSPLNGEEINMGDPATLASFVTFASAKNPADHKLLIFWDHGSPRGVAWDDHASDAGGEDYLSHWEVAQGLAGQKVDVIGADECNVGQLEVAYEYATSTQTEYLVAAQTYTGWRGFPYDQTLRELTRDPDMTPRETAIMLFEQTQLLLNKPPYMGECVNTHSATDLSKVGELASSLKGLTDLLIEDMAASAGVVAMARGTAQYCYGSNAINIVDLRTFVSSIGSQTASMAVRDACALVLADFDAAVVAVHAAKSLRNMVSGLGISLPDHSWELPGYYGDFAFSNQGWLTFLEAYWAAHGVA